MGGWVRDLRHAGRTLLRSPGFTLVAVASLALGIGGNTAIFTLVDAVLLRPLPVEEPDRLFDIYTLDGSNAGRNYIPVSVPNFLDLRDETRSFGDVVAVAGAGLAVEVGSEGETQGVPGAVVTGSYFETLGVEPHLGRLLHPSDDGPRGTGAVAVLSHATWTRLFGADSTVVGRTVRMNGVPLEVVGVAPAGFRGRQTLTSPERIWVPFSMLYELTPPQVHFFFEVRRALPVELFGRLAPGVEPQAAQAELTAIAARLEQAYPDDNRDRTFAMVPTTRAAVGANQWETLTRSGAAGMGVVGLILLIACANLANLLLARAAGRSRELALRAALGASRGALVRQMLVESLVLSFLGAALGLVLARWGSGFLLGLGSSLVPPSAVELALDGRVLTFTAVLAVGTGILFGAVPALRAARADLNGLLKEGGRQGGGLVRSPLRSGLVVAEVGLAVVGLVGAGLFLRSMLAAGEAPTGYDTRGLGVVGMSLGQGFGPQEALDFMDRARDAALSVPGVLAAGVAGATPLTGIPVRTLVPEGAGPDDRGSSFVGVVPVMPGYLETLGLAAVRGRLPAADDLDPGARPVAVVNEALVERYWPGTDPIGRRFSFFADSVVREVVGVVPTVAFEQAGELPQPAAYLPWSQWPQGFGVLHVRSAGDGAVALGAVADRLRELDPDRTLQAPRTAQDLRRDTLRARRIGAGLVGSFGLIALVLAVVGIHAVMTTVSQQRTHEIGVRMALGARPRDVLWMVVGQGMGLVAAGIVLGSGVALAAGRVVGALLFDVRPHDPVTFAAVAGLLGGVAFLACFVPALRSTRTPPARALSPD